MRENEPGGKKNFPRNENEFFVDCGERVSVRENITIITIRCRLFTAPKYPIHILFYNKNK
jgi:hypothetical protein